MAPSGRELAPKATEGERVTIKLIKTPKSRRLLPPLSRSPSLSEGGFGKLPPTEKHHQRKILGGVRVFFAKVAEATELFFALCEFFNLYITMRKYYLFRLFGVSVFHFKTQTFTI